MKNLTQKILLVFLFLIFPFFVSNTSVIEKSDAEKLEETLRIRELMIKSEINAELELFYVNLEKETRICYIHDFFNEVIHEAIESKSLPSIAIAQAAIETGYGKSKKLGNNIFGIKGRGIRTITHEVYNGKRVKISANFQYFPTLTDAFNKHSQILARYGATGNDYELWIDRIEACGYATDPLYSFKIRFVIEKYQLYRLDTIQKLKEKIPVERQEFCNPQPIFIV